MVFKNLKKKLVKTKPEILQKINKINSETAKNGFLKQFFIQFFF